jgi:hypothetical protein
MQNEIVSDIDIAIKLIESDGECSCDPEVGWVCERCFLLTTLANALRLLTPLAPDRLAVGGLGDNPLQSSEKAEVSPATIGGR